MGTVPLSTIPGHALVLMGASGEQMVKFRFLHYKHPLVTLDIYKRLRERSRALSFFDDFDEAKWRKNQPPEGVRPIFR